MAGSSGWALMSVALPEGETSLAEAARLLGVSDAALDADYGLVPIDRSRNLYAVQVRAEEIAGSTLGDAARGPFSNPRIAPFSMDTDD